MTAREQLKAWLQRSKLSQNALAAELGVVAPILSNWLTGKRRPTLAQAVRIEDKTGVPIRSWMLSSLSRHSDSDQADQAKPSKSGPGTRSSRG